jgi:lincosamide nucleotidyltransferase A/C/D/E
MSDRSLRARVGGGWAVDALVGHPTRAHQDLDLAVNAEQLDSILLLLHSLGYQPRQDWLPVRIELEDASGQRVDLHPLVFAADGSAVQAGLHGATFYYPSTAFTTGVIDGVSVECLTAEQQLSFREGYPWRDRDHHDVALLRQVQRLSAAPSAPSR